MSLSGRVDALGRPRVLIWLRGIRRTSSYEAVIDTGFTGMLGVSDEIVAHLGMRRWSSAAYYGADGKVHGIATYLGELKWIDEWGPVEVSESGVQEVLIGAGLLKGLALSIDYGAAQSVEIR